MGNCAGKMVDEDNHSNAIEWDKNRVSPKVFLALFLTVCPVLLLLRPYFSCLQLCKRLSIVDERFKCTKCQPNSGTFLEKTRDITLLCPC